MQPNASTATLRPTAGALNVPHRYEALDSLRGICALVVVLFHFRNTDVITNLPVIDNGWILVDFFFVLSGFVIFASYGERLRSGYSFKKFIALRLGRIYPLHLVMLAAFVGMETLVQIAPGLSSRPAFTGNKQVEDAIAHIFLLQNLTSNEGVTWNYPAWSIASEFWTYVTIGIGLSAISRHFYLFLWILVLASTAALSSTGTLDHSGLLSIPRCIIGFALGIFAWNLLPRLKAVPLSSVQATLIEAALVSSILVFVSLTAKSAFTLLAPPLFFVAVLAFALERGLLSSLLRTRGFLLLGTLSYSIYMVHVFVQSRLLDVLHIAGKVTGWNVIATTPSGAREIHAPPLVADLITMVMLLAVVAVSYGTFYLIETPARNLSRKIFGGPARTPAVDGLAPGSVSV